MAKFEENMNEIFDLAPAEDKVNLAKVTSSELNTELNQIDIDKDYEHARAQLYSLIDKGQEAVSGILDVAMSSDHPRAYEVAGQLIKHVADVTDKLADLQKKMKDLKGESKKSSPQTVNNSIFFGSTADLQKMIKEFNPDK